MKRASTLLAFLTLALASLPLRAELSVSFGDYVIHYNAFTSDTLQPAIARAYGITRSKNRGVLTVVVLKKVLETTGKPIHAQIKATAVNLTGQLKNIELREIREGNALYYLGEFPVANGEVLDFTLKVIPEGEKEAFTITFRKRFFTD